MIFIKKKLLDKEKSKFSISFIQDVLDENSKSVKILYNIKRDKKWSHSSNVSNPYS